MHLEILVEDQSGKRLLDQIVGRIVPEGHTFRVHAYKGIGRLPRNMVGTTDASKRILLDQLPRLLQGYGNTFAKNPSGYHAAVVIVCDLDDNPRSEFYRELIAVRDACSPKPDAYFCIAIEEGEAWLLGDSAAVKKSYPAAKDTVLYSYVNDSICGTWEWLADAIYPGGSRTLLQKGWQAVGAEKSNWATNIPPHMDIDNNKSPSFTLFRDTIIDILRTSESGA